MFGCGEDSTLIHAQAAISAGIATSTATNPIWLVKTRLQLDKAQTSTGNRRYKNSLDCIRQVLRQEGLGGLYKGLSASYLGAAETALHLVLYERLKGILQRSLVSPDGTDTPTQREITSWISTTGAAGSAKFAAALIAYPHEVRKMTSSARRLATFSVNFFPFLTVSCYRSFVPVFARLLSKTAAPNTPAWCSASDSLLKKRAWLVSTVD